jgi:hypothetical protein
MKIIEFAPTFIALCSETYHILQSGHLNLHPAVTQVTLHGSRGLAGNPRPDSDIDLSLLVSTPVPPRIGHELEGLLQAVLNVTLSNWHSLIELDLAAIFPIHPCKFACFQVNDYDAALCSLGGIDCFGIYKIQKGFSGFVLNAGIQVEKMYPLITVWKNNRD